MAPVAGVVVLNDAKVLVICTQAISSLVACGCILMLASHRVVLLLVNSCVLCHTACLPSCMHKLSVVYKPVLCCRSPKPFAMMLRLLASRSACLTETSTCPAGDTSPTECHPDRTRLTSQHNHRCWGFCDAGRRARSTRGHRYVLQGT